MQLDEGKLPDCGDSKFVDLSPNEQKTFVAAHFSYKNGNWFDEQGEFAGASTTEVIAALIDYEHAAINAIGDCMAGFSITQPKFSQFVRKNKE